MTTERLEKDSLTDYCQEIARTIGGSVSAERVRRVINLSNDGKHLLQVNLQNCEELKPRRYSQALEREMFRLIEKCLVDGYETGKREVTSINS